MVTPVDLEIQQFITNALRLHFPDDGIVAEEANIKKAPSKNSSTHWVIDPIDGTASYVSGFPAWGISIGIVKEHCPYAGFFLMPITGDYFMVSQDTPVLRNGSTVKLSPLTKLNRETVLLTQSSLHSQNFAIGNSYPGKVQGYGSNVAHLSYVASGMANAVLLNRVKLWDLIVGWTMLNKNGGVFQTLDGEENLCIQSLLAGDRTSAPILAGHPGFVEQYQSVLIQKEQVKVPLLKF